MTKSPAVRRSFAAQKILDGWRNILTGMGVIGKDSRLAATAQYNGEITEREVECLYAGDSMAARIVDVLANDATRAWVNIKSEDNQKEITDDMARLQVQSKFNQAARWARAYGGAGIFFSVDDGGTDLAEPLNLATLRKVNALHVLTRHEIFVTGGDINTDINADNFGQPEWYNLSVSTGTGVGAARIHRSRLLILNGKELPRSLYIENSYWGASIFTAMLEALRDYNTGHASIASIIQDFRVVVYKMDNLAKAIAAGKADEIKKRVATLNEVKSVFGAYFMDKDGESMEFSSPSLGGIKDVMDKIKARLQSATDMPAFKLFNESPSGIGADGRAEERGWWSTVEAYQSNELEPELERYFEITHNAKEGPTNGIMADDFEWDWAPLFMLTEKEQADVDKTNADTDNIYANLGATTPLEIRTNRFPERDEVPTGAELMTEERATELEAEMNRLKAEAEEAKKQAAAGDEPEPEPDPT